MITSEQIEEHIDKNSCFICLKHFSKLVDVYCIKRLHIDKSGNNFDFADYITDKNEYYTQVYVCSDCWVETAGKEWEMA